MMLRRKALVFIVTLLVTASLLTVFTGCRGVTQAIIGSGNLITQEMDSTDFTKLEISHVFQAKVTRSDSFFVSITVDDNLLEYVVVRKSGNTLRIYLKAGYAYIGTTKMVEITMPKIDKLSLSGASRVEVSGFRSSDRLEFDAVGSIEIANGIFNVSGASSINLEGYASDISIEVSGASHVNLANLSVSNATIRISGASVVTVSASGTIDGNISGASRLTYLGDPALTIEMSGDSTVDSR
jgi:hypothetical protein